MANTVSPLNHHFVHCSVGRGPERTGSGPREFKRRGGWETGGFAIYEMLFQIDSDEVRIYFLVVDAFQMLSFWR